MQPTPTKATLFAFQEQEPPDALSVAFAYIISLSLHNALWAVRCCHPHCSGKKNWASETLTHITELKIREAGIWTQGLLQNQCSFHCAMLSLRVLSQNNSWQIYKVHRLPLFVLYVPPEWPHFTSSESRSLSNLSWQDQKFIYNMDNWGVGKRIFYSSQEYLNVNVSCPIALRLKCE